MREIIVEWPDENPPGSDEDYWVEELEDDTPGDTVVEVPEPPEAWQFHANHDQKSHGRGGGGGDSASAEGERPLLPKWSNEGVKQDGVLVISTKTAKTEKFNKLCDEVAARHPNTDFSAFQSLKANAANEASVKELDRLLTKYPKMAQTLERVGMNMNPMSGTYAQTTINFIPSLAPDPNPRSTISLVNMYYGKTMPTSTLARDVKADIKAGHLTANGPEGIITHEMGHVLHQAYEAKQKHTTEAGFYKNSKIERGASKIMTERAIANMDVNATKIPYLSKYSQRNYQEEFAEAFVAHELGKGKGHPMVKLVEEIIAEVEA